MPPIFGPVFTPFRNRRRFLASTLIAVSFFWTVNSAEPAESINRIIATIGSQSISELDYDDALDKYLKLSRFLKNEDMRKSQRTRVIDFLIDRAIVDAIADEESIQVNQKRLEGEIDKRMELMGLTSRKQFEKAIEASSGMSYDLWITELPYQIKRGQLLQYKVPMPPPAEKDVRNWYAQNKEKVGFEIQYRLIAIAPNNDSIAEEARIHKEATELRKTLQADANSFTLIAGSPRNSDVRLRGRKGLVDWISSFELYKISKSSAIAASPLQAGSISEVFRDEYKRYCILKVEGKRTTPFDTIKAGIMNILAREKEEENFQKWVREQRSTVPIQIFDDAYKKENKIPDHKESIHLD
ncbi:peptidyl-prolyl cis-trans isomerase, TIGR04142 family [Leptospira inadai serovar Lyme str. 10]|uniref:Peptidyl-prolyl cis-trans isomerase, TIGR04142 family n=2 Tax=Leptospira inadai serovar Lyme TaxID=293084 RepID=V6HCS6_9LEPT|nr:putative peptidyl-prolyl cis-trans isomerase [Leptospira inadai]EQA37502.1 peptidyl-prolyl cis-trans isomerase, TIGR04142 family [Leptospira inadai serovar Lyme str. 10]PNV75075.1 putative peptidyl-prolyl cis-trans isomerase [Leptospira inadai serovar Lyme]